MMMQLVRIVAIVFPILALPSTVWGISFSTNFDGLASGGGFSIDKFQASSPRSRTNSDSSSRTGPQSNSSDSGDIQKFLKDQYEEQLREAERRAEEERLRKEMELAKLRQDLSKIQTLLEQIQRLESDEPSVVKRAAYTQQVLDLQKQFEAARSAYMATLPSKTARLAASLNHINVPPPSHPLHYNRILIWGLWSTPEEARDAASGRKDPKKGPEKDPFTGLPFDDVFAFGSNRVADLLRVGLDHLLGEMDLLSPSTSSQLGELKGATADEVVCHSNGCRIAEVLISTGMLKAKKLRILGGDNAALELDSLRALKQQKGLDEVSVYLMQGDVVPLDGVGWKIMELTTKIGQPLMSFQSKRGDPTYQLLGLTDRPRFSPSDDVQVHVITYPTASNPVDQHRFDHYSRVVNGLRLTNCLDAGAMSQRCIIY